MDYLVNNPGWAISVPEWAVVTPDVNTLFNYQITYEKGACILHQLRYILGDTLFFSGMRAYSADTTLRFKNATTVDFNGKINQISGNNYDWYFNDWIFQPNNPEYVNSYDFTNLGGGQWRVDFATTQQQTTPAFFRMLLNVKVIFTDNSDTTVRFMNDLNNQSFSWTFGKQPSTLVFDAKNDIVLKQAVTLLGVSSSRSCSEKFKLMNNVPNPATYSTKIIFETSVPMPVRLDVLDLTGKVLSSADHGICQKGNHTIDLDCSTLAPGIYFYRMQAGDESQVRKMVIQK